MCFAAVPTTVDGTPLCSVFAQLHFEQTPLSSLQPQPQLLHSGACCFGTGRDGTSGSQPLLLEEDEDDEEEEDELDEEELDSADALLGEEVLDVLLVDEPLETLDGLLDDEELEVLLGNEELLVDDDEESLLGDAGELNDDELLLLDDEEDGELVEDGELSEDPMGGSVELLLLDDEPLRLDDELLELDDEDMEPPDHSRLPASVLVPGQQSLVCGTKSLLCAFTSANAECYKIRAKLVRSDQLSHLIVRRL